MAKSMTGYGNGESQQEGRKFRVECRTVNHRYLDIAVRAPAWLLSYEPLVRTLATERLGRGRVEIRVTDESGAGESSEVTVDRGLVASYLRALEELAQITGEPLSDPTGFLARQPGILIAGERDEDEETVEALLKEALLFALDELNRTREEEGARLVADLLEKVQELREAILLIEERAPKVPGIYREKLLKRAEELFLEERPEWYSDQRLFAEVALFADRASIDEEITRLKAHADALDAALLSDAPVGRQLDFLIQEVFREINTIGSKANDLDLTETVVAVKTLLEKIREQVQNLE